MKALDLELVASFHSFVVVADQSDNDRTAEQAVGPFPFVLDLASSLHVEVGDAS